MLSCDTKRVDCKATSKYVTVRRLLLISRVMDIATSNQTIFALASGIGKAGVAVFRISGPHARNALSRLTRKPLPEPRYARRMKLMEINSGELSISNLIFWL